jgi:hypothetical protein
MKIAEKYCILDIETWTPSGKVDPNIDELRYVGFMAEGRKVCYHASQVNEIQTAINYFDYLVGHHIEKYDLIVLKRHGFKFYGKYIIDTFKIADNRLKTMMYLDLNQASRSLSSLCQIFNLTHVKGSYSYSKLEATYLEGEDLDELVGYLYGDLEATNELFQYFYDFFYGFSEYMSPENKKRMSWLTASAGATAYKAICHQAQLKEEYDDTVEGKNKAYAGGFVSEPYIDFVEG